MAFFEVVPGDAKSRLEDCLCDIRQVGADVLDRQRTGDVGRRNPQQVHLFKPPELVHLFFQNSFDSALVSDRS
jgi:hypothetical protein